MTGGVPGTLEKGSGTAVVMLHGIGGCAEVWRPQIGILRREISRACLGPAGIRCNAAA